jgi:hypothetical protein
MPLLDHFHPPLHPRRHWENFHGQWASCLAAQLNQGLLPPDHYAEMQVTLGRVEVDVATQHQGNGAAGSAPSSSSGGVATVAAPVWAPVAPALEMDAVFPPTFSILVFTTSGGVTLVGAIELVSPANKARPSERRAFAVKCLSYLYSGVGVIVVDVVTDRLANLHDEIATVLVGNAPRFPDTPSTYAAAYRPFRCGDEEKIAVWPVPLAVGGQLPVLPLWLRDVEAPVRVDLEAAYTEARQRSAIG